MAHTRGGVKSPKWKSRLENCLLYTAFCYVLMGKKYASSISQIIYKSTYEQINGEEWLYTQEIERKKEADRIIKSE